MRRGRRAFVVDGQRAAALIDRAIVDHRHARRGDPLADPAGEGRRALAVEVAFEPVADRLVEQHAGPAGAEHDLHLARRGGDRFEIGQRLGERDVDRPAPRRLLEQAVIEVAPAEPVVAGLAPAILFGDDLHPEPDQRPDVRSDEAVGADDVDHAPARRQRDADLGDARIAGAGGGVDPLAQGDLFGERDEAQRIVGAVHRLVGPLRRRGRSALGRIEQFEGGSGALDRRFADLIGVSESGGFAGDAAQAEARRRMIIGRLQASVVEAECLAGAILEVEFAIVAARQVLRGQLPRAVRIEAAIEKPPGIGRGHAAWLSAGPPSRTKRRSQ